MINYFKRDEYGAALVEYGILVGFIAVVCLAALELLGNQLTAFFTVINTALALV